MTIELEPGTIDIQDLARTVGVDAEFIIEVGANCGQSTVELRRAFPAAQFHCFEPDPRAIRKFRHNTRDLEGITLNETAIGNASGATQFWQSDAEGENAGWDQSGSIREPKLHTEEWPWVKFESMISVAIEKLDNYRPAADRAIIDLIWADVQGAEIDLIKGGARTLAKTRFFYTEYGDVEFYEGQINLDEITELIAPMGFELIRKFRMDALFVNARVL